MTWSRQKSSQEAYSNFTIDAGMRLKSNACHPYYPTHLTLGDRTGEFHGWDVCIHN